MSEHSSNLSASSASVHMNLLRDRGGDSSLHSSGHNQRRSGGRSADPFSKYEIVEILGQGSMGAVSKVCIQPDAVGGSAFPKPKKVRGVFRFANLFAGRKRKQSKESSSHSQRPAAGEYYYALKSIQLDRISDQFLQELRNEIDIIRSLDHPNIVKAHEVYENRGQIFLVLELLDGGDLYARSPYSERKACRYVTQMLSAVRYMHDRGVIHRDLKFENICFENQHPDAVVKIIDFGLSKKFLSGRAGMMTDRVGTIYTMSPQVLDGFYSSKADLWSVGVISYMLLSAARPFHAKKRRHMVALILSGQYRPMDSSPVWENISEDAKDFVRKLLVVEPKDRMDAAQALTHPWIRRRYEEPTSGGSSTSSSSGDLPQNVPKEQLSKEEMDAMQSFRDYVNTSKLKKLGLMVIAHRSSRRDIVELRQAFERYDTGKDGVLSFAEFKAAMEQTGNYTDEDIQDIFASVDVNENGHIMYTEFLAATIEAHGHIEEDRIAEAFDRLDADDSGYISRENIASIVGKDLGPEEYREIIAQIDTDGDGKISYEEFLGAFRKRTSVIARKMSSVEELEDGEV